MAINSVIFTDGTQFYDELSQKYVKHDKGLMIWAPSGAGKTHFCLAQTEKHWIDGDDLWIESHAQPPIEEKWWTQSGEVMDRIDRRSDIITMEAKLQGFWIIGASAIWLPPDAVVIPDWETLEAQIRHRQENNYDGGATTDQFSQVKGHIEFIKKQFPDVPVFKTVEEAVKSLTGEN